MPADNPPHRKNPRTVGRTPRSNADPNRAEIDGKNDVNQEVEGLTSGSKTKIGRRAVLKVTGASVSLGTLPSIGVADETVEIVTERRGSRPYHTKNVPRKWNEYIERTEHVRKVLKNQHAGNPDVFDVRIVPSDEVVAGKGVNQVGVVLKEGSPIVDELPDQVDGVSVTVEERESFDLELQSHRLCYNNGDYDYAWGGVAVQSDADDDGTVDYNGTGCCPVKRNGTEYYLTANHLFLSGDSCEGNWSDDLWQHSKSSANYLGEVYRYREKMDFAIVGPIEMSPIYDIKNARWSGYIKSHATKKRCQEMMGNGTTVAKMGITTGEETGTIATLEATFSYGCVDLGGNGIGIDADCANGDSGGPYYAESETSSGDIAIVGCHSGTPNWLSNGSECGNDTFSRAAGAPAYHMASELGLTFGI